MGKHVTVKAKNKEFREEFIKFDLEANTEINGYFSFYASHKEKLNKMYSDLKIRFTEEDKGGKVYFEMSFEIPYTEIIENGYNETIHNEMKNFVHLIEPILKILSQKGEFAEIFDDTKSPDSIKVNI